MASGKIIVGFEEETNRRIRKLASGLADLDFILIAGMPGWVSGKKVKNDKSISSHFDIRAWCTVCQEYVEKELLNKIFNQVTGSDSKLSENNDAVDKVRKQLYGKWSLIVLDDLCDNTKRDDLTRPLQEVEKASRFIFITHNQ